VILAPLLLLAAIHAPEECLVTRGAAPFSVVHGAKTYGFRYADCREEFLTDPERFAQLYDALLEMHAEGLKVEKPKASLVPS
jgi:YHS domain-containing protein